MHRKTTILDHNKFMLKFFGDVDGEDVDIFDGLPTPTKESPMYDTMPDKLNESEICPGYVFVAHPTRSDTADTGKLGVDCGMYPEQYVPQLPAGKSGFPPVDWSELEIPIECKTKPNDQDPFEDDSPHYEPTVDSRKAVLGQILSYAELVFRHQQRTFFYMVVFLGDYARILRIDRSSIFATEKFNYKTESSKLSQFLSRYTKLPPAKRGHDTSATRVRPGTKLWKKMLSRRTDTPKDHRQQYFSDSLDENWAWWELKVPVGTTHYEKFLVGKPHFIAPGVVGRGTRGYVALPVNSKGKAKGKFVYLKDAWRVDHPGIDQEGSILQELNEKNVQHVPTLVCHGDLAGAEQVTDWRDFWAECHAVKGVKPAASASPLKRHQHYRLVVKEVGKPLHEFGDSSVELILALFYCLLAHKQAYNVGIIHRDLSTGNILLIKDDKSGKWVGMLNDWELSKRISTEVLEARQPDRTGTWQFMSAHALNDEDRPIVLEDELESVLHILLYIAIRFIRSNLAPANVGQFLHDYFDSYSASATAYRCGSAKLAAMEHGVISLRRYNGDTDDRKLSLKFYWSKSTASTSSTSSESESDSEASGSTPSPPDQSSSSTAPLHPDVDLSRPHPINFIFDGLLSWFKAYYAEDQATKDSVTKDSSVGSGDSDEGFDLDIPDVMESEVFTYRNADTSKSSDEVEVNRATLRDNLRRHDAVIGLFKEGLKRAKWPKNDRVKDMKPKDGYVIPKDQGPMSSVTRTSQKRSCEEGETTSRSTKRSRN
ncbi:hypothetical protein C8Q74DRAFT_926778 [Fomes fomentarius]|nr:hypothetical protein C8Q74DRAFT_926778 [Fomes fomentarius]